ncbi:MAG: flavin-containing monooxygenase [Myxococcota bacterium]
MVINQQHVDVLIVGAGLSGIGAAYHLQTECPDRSYLILEGREQLGGTWDLFRYPGIRSDSDMHTMGYGFKPWTERRAISDGASILSYLQETAGEHGITDKIRFNRRVLRASWSTAEGMWTLEVAHGDARERWTCQFLMMCAGYYSYKGGHTPEFAGRERFDGPVIHPQAWPEDLDYTGQRVVIVGSGATAVTLLPAMAPDAGHVTMVQRSPSYILNWPAKDHLANLLRAVLPEMLAYRLARAKNIKMQQWAYKQTRIRPHLVRRWLLRRARKALGPDFDLETHLTPAYDPWDERLCLSPDGDFYAAIRAGNASIVTGEVSHFTAQGVGLTDGREVPADVVVTATGLKLVVLGEIDFEVDGKAIDFSQTFTYKGVCFSGIPNLATVFGYVNASWTLRADLIAAYVCRLLNHMRERGASRCTPTLGPAEREMVAKPFIEGFSPGYLKRAFSMLPRQGEAYPWRNPQDLASDRQQLAVAPVDDGVMRFE